MKPSRVLILRVFQTRLRIIGIILLLIYLIVIWRLFMLQVVSGSEYRVKVDGRYTSATSQLIANRGAVYFVDRAGDRVIAAGNIVQYRIVLEPKRIESPQDVRNFFNDFISDPDSETLERAFVSTKLAIQTKNTVSREEAERIRKSLVPGVLLKQEYVRAYPLGSAGSHVLGFIAYGKDLLAGQYGLERQYESNLRGSSRSLYQNFFTDLFSSVQVLTNPEKIELGSANVITTIDPSIQNFAENTLDDLVKKWSPDEAGIIIMDPRSGAIRAMSARPTFNPNNFSQEQSSAVFTNPMVQHVYEVGSIMKPLIMAFGFDQGVVAPETVYTDQGSIQIQDRTIWNFDRKARGRVNMETVLIQSLNTGMVFIMEKLDRTAVRTYFDTLGFGEKTGIDLPFETGGILTNIRRGHQVEFANASFGQGVAVTPIGMIRALSIIANDGVLVTPHLVTGVEYPLGNKITPDIPKPIQVVSVKSARAVAGIMTKLVDQNFGTNGVAIPHYSVAAKTGTAQIPNPTGGYYEDRNLHSFFGFFPATKPEYSVYIYMVHPRGAQYSAETLSKPFLTLVQRIINYASIPPDRGLDDVAAEQLDNSIKPVAE